MSSEKFATGGKITGPGNRPISWVAPGFAISARHMDDMSPGLLASINRGIADVEAGRTVSSDWLFAGEGESCA